MNKQATALVLRATALALERAKQVCKALPPGTVDDDSALALWLDAPRVVRALFDVAGTLDPTGEAAPQAQDRWAGMVPPDEADEVVDMAELATLGKQPRS